jgi:predicted transcriptional regulator
MDEALEVAEFLARSENRVAVLQQLREGPATRRGLRDATGISPVTLGRILGDFTDRGWIESGGAGYRVTALGELVVESLEAFLDALDAVVTLQPFARWLPTDEYDFGLERLADASVFRPDPTDPNVTMRVAAQQVASSDHVRILTHGFSTLVVNVLHDRVTAGEMTVENVYAGSVYETVARAEGVSDEFRALFEADGATFYRYDGEVPHVLAILDDGVGIGVDDERGRPQAVLDVEDSVVRDWAVETFERYRAEATEVVDVDELVEGGR